ncbi:glycine cleavage system protein H [Halobacteriales archaeon QH_1_68_42]|jgi:glycine cleavage system H protein|nr:MAG: glycine cleavage system protein H [Halobacteriales archaeon QH_1_68_42]
MNFEFPTDRRYAESHEWANEQDGVVRVGISDFAQDELGDVVFVELPGEGESFDRGSSFGVVESIKAVSDLYAPVSGTVVDTNDALQDTPELINEDPFGDGWLITLDPEGELDQLLTADEYRQQV